MFKNRNLEHPDGTIHKIHIKKFGYNKKLNKYFIYYYDKNNKDNEYTILDKVKNTYILNLDDETEYEELIKRHKKLKVNDLPSTIKCNLKKETNNKENHKYLKSIKKYINKKYTNIKNSKTNKQKSEEKNNKDIKTKNKEQKKNKKWLNIDAIKSYFTLKKYNTIMNNMKKAKNTKSDSKGNTTKELKIYQTNENDFYIASTICEKLKIGNANKTQNFDGIPCYKVSKEEINNLEKKRNLKCKYIKKTLLTYFRVFETSEGLYMSEKLCNDYSLGDKSNSKEIENITCLKVTKEAIEKTEKEHPNFKANYKPINSKEKTTEKEKEKIKIKIYRDKNNTYYISEKVYNALKLEQKSTNKKIDNEYYLSISKEELDIISNKLKELNFNFEFKEQELVEENNLEIKPNKEQKDKLIPGTNIYLPRDRKILETDEEYEAFLERYYNKYVIKKERNKDQKDKLIPGTNIYLPRDRKILETDEEYETFLEEYYNKYLGNIDNYNEKKLTK